MALRFAFSSMVPQRRAERLCQIVYLFDGRDEDARAKAREQWKRAKAEGHAVTFWQQNDGGRWEKKA